MKWLSVIFFLSTLAFFSRAGEHTPNLQNQNNSPEVHPNTEVLTQFSLCESKVTKLSSKYFGRNNSLRAFHLMLACGGLQGDPISRKGWKNYLPICPAEPPSEGNWTQDKPRFVSQYHICADSCYRRSSRKSWSEIMTEDRGLLKKSAPEMQKRYAWYNQLSGEDFNILSRHFPAQQCCYSKGKLVTQGPGAGTPDVIFIFPGRTPKRLRPAGPLRAALFHEKFDVQIIEEKFPSWPKGWDDYFQLGWAPVPTRAPKYWGFDQYNRSCERFNNK
jgi:hypothetical protein